jgi:hypothetical protein
MELLLILLGLGLVALVGHGIWVSLAWVLRALAGGETAPPPRRRLEPEREMCPQCGRPVPSWLSRCQSCGLDPQSLAARELRDLAVTARELAVLANAGNINQATLDRLRESIEERRRFLTKPRVPIPKAAPVPASVPASQTAQEVLEVIPLLAEVAQATPELVVRSPDRVTPVPRPVPRRRPPRPPKPPRRTLAEILAAFMEERNIFWGELAGGLLMVGSSIALVIYLWKDLQRIPYFQFLIFVSTTAAVFGAGLYALYRLKLATTGRGLLAIATLLVPLNFLVMAGLSGQAGESDSSLALYRLATEALSLAVFGGLMIPAARALVPEGRWWLIFAVLGASVSQLAVPRLLSDRQSIPVEWFAALGCLPVLCHFFGAGALVGRLSRCRPFQESHAQSLLAFLGLATFPLLVALGFLTYWSIDIGLALERLSPLLSVTGTTILAGGLLIHRRLAKPVSTEAAASPAGSPAPTHAPALRMAGTAVALGGMAFMLGAAALAWPQPMAVLLVCALDFLVLTAVALFFDLPIAHAAALPCLLISYLTAFHYFAGHLAAPRAELGGRLLDQALSAQSGSILVFLVVLLGMSAEILVRSGKRIHGIFYAVGAGVGGVLSLTLVNLRGVQDPATAALITGTYGAGSLLMNVRYRRSVINYLGLVLIVATTLWILWWRQAAFTPTWATTLAIESAALALAAVASPIRLPISRACRDISLLTAGLALGLGLWLFSSSPHLWPRCTIPLGVTAFLLAFAYRSSLLSWVGSGLILATFLHALFWNPTPLHADLPVNLALSLHATVVLAASLVLKAFVGGSRAAANPEPSTSPSASYLDRLYRLPLLESALVSSVCTLPLVFALAWPQMYAIAWYLGWLSILWFVIAWEARSPLLFTLFQLGVTATVFFGYTAGLERWTGGRLPDLLEDPQILRGYGVALAGLGFYWLLARLSLRRNELGRKLLNPPWPSVDWIVLGAVLLGQVGLAIWDVLPAIIQEFQLQPFDLPVGHHAFHFGPSPWALPAVLALVLMMALWTRQQAGAVLGLVLLAVPVPLQAAAEFRPEAASVFVMRLGLAGCFLAGSLLLWRSDRLADLARRLGCPSDPALQISVYARRLLTACTAFPILVLAVAWVFFVLNWPHSVGSLEGSVFARIGPVAAYAIPLLIVTVTLVGQAIREKSADYQFSAGFLINLAVTGGYMVAVALGDQGFHQADWVRVIQVGSITAAVWSLIWLAGRRVDVPQLCLAVGGNAFLLIWPAVWLVAQPGELLPSDLMRVGDWMGWLALVVSAVATFWYAGQFESRSRGHVLVAFGLALGILVACSASRVSQPGDWRAYHILMATWLGVGLIVGAAEWIARMPDKLLDEFSSLPFLARFFDFSAGQLRGWLHLIGGLVLALALRGMLEDPGRPYWSAGATLAVSIMAGFLAIRSQRPIYVYTSGLLVNLAGSMIWLAWGPGTLPSFAYTQVLCLGLAGGCWLILELIVQSLPSPLRIRRPGLPFAHFAVLLGLGILGLLVATELGSEVFSLELQVADALSWAALAAIVACMILCLWDPEARFTLAGLYLAGLLTLGRGLHLLEWQPIWLSWTATLLLAGYLLLSAAIGWIAPKFAVLWRDLLLPQRCAPWPEAWFAPVQTVLALFVLASSLWICLSFETLTARLAGPVAVVLLVPAGVLMSQFIPSRWGSDLRYATLTLGVCACIEGGWALLDLTGPAAWLYRNLLLMESLALMTVVYGAGLGKILPQPSAWSVCGRRFGPVLGILATVMLLVVLGQEGFLYDVQADRTLMEPVAVGAVAITFVCLSAAGIYFAVVPGRDPFRLSGRGRMLYVYVAEVLLALLFVHLRLTVPWIFRHWLAPYWTFVVMAVAFTGVGLSEFFSRRGLRVLSEPLQRTGVFVPLLPLIVFWVHPPAVLHEYAPRHLPALVPVLAHLEGVPPNFGKYSLLWFLLGMLYAWVARSKGSPRYALLAALAANAGIWTLLYHQHLSFLTHPQPWLVPFALILLVAEHLNRDELPAAQSSALRYAGLLMIYVSSTADMFIAGLVQVLFPLILAVLSVLGILSGMLLRVRAFVYLGVSFLFLVMVSMIWHAAVELHQGWLWWASGIVLGAAIIILFAVFENRRKDVLRVIDELKKWS